MWCLARPPAIIEYTSNCIFILNVLWGHWMLGEALHRNESARPFNFVLMAVEHTFPLLMSKRRCSASCFLIEINWYPFVCVFYNIFIINSTYVRVFFFSFIRLLHHSNFSYEYINAFQTLDLKKQYNVMPNLLYWWFIDWLTTFVFCFVRLFLVGNGHRVKIRQNSGRSHG